MNTYINDELNKLSSSGLKRSLTKVCGPQGPRVVIDGKEVILLCSNDYLGLANDPAVKQAAVKAIERWGAGAGASRLVSGTMEPHLLLEERIRAFKKAETALLFNSGYNANLSLITALAGRTTEIFSDRLNHASIVDACVLSRARVKRYSGGDFDSLERLLKKSAAARKIIITEGVFSMDGSIPPLKEITGLLDRYNATLILDDAHATGVLGKNGRGTLEYLNLSHPSIIEMGTLGKALGSFGAFVAGSKALVDLLISKARPFIYTTALPPSVCASASSAFDLIEERPLLRQRLRENVSFFKDGLKSAGVDYMGSPSQIIPVVTGSAGSAVEISRRLLEKGVFIQGIRPPTVPENTARLRITITASHSREDLCYALDAIKKVFEGYKGRSSL